MWRYLESLYRFFWLNLLGLSDSLSTIMAERLGVTIDRLHEYLLALALFLLFTSLLLNIFLLIKKRGQYEKAQRTTTRC